MKKYVLQFNIEDYFENEEKAVVFCELIKRMIERVRKDNYIFEKTNETSCFIQEESDEDSEYENSSESSIDN